MDDFAYIWIMDPIDFFNGATLADFKNTEKVLNCMPEKLRDGEVYVVNMPCDGNFVPMYICKADNNGTTYCFSDYDIFGYYLKTIMRF